MVSSSNFKRVLVIKLQFFVSFLMISTLCFVFFLISNKLNFMANCRMINFSIVSARFRLDLLKSILYVLLLFEKKIKKKLIRKHIFVPFFFYFNNHKYFNVLMVETQLLWTLITNKICVDKLFFNFVHFCFLFSPLFWQFRKCFSIFLGSLSKL